MDILNFDVDDLRLDQFIDFNIEGIIYTFRFRYNSREGWYVGIYDPQLISKDSVKFEDLKKAKLYGEVKVMPSQNILKFSSSSRLPSGYLTFTDTELRSVQDYRIPMFDEIGTDKRFTLTYSTRAELEELGLEWLI